MFSVLVAAALPAAAIEPPFEAVRKGAHCNLETDGSLTCRYRAGRDLAFELRRIGERQAHLVVRRSSEAGGTSSSTGSCRLRVVSQGSESTTASCSSR